MNLVQQKAIEHLEALIKKLKDQTAIIDRFDIEGGNDAEGHYLLTNIGVFYMSELKKPSINWNHVSPKFKWLARDKCGNSYLYPEIPHCVVGEEYWASDGPSGWVKADVHSSYNPGNCDWKDSLVERPE